MELSLTALLAREEVREKVLALAEVHSLAPQLFEPFNYRTAQLFTFESDYVNVLEMNVVLRAAAFTLTKDLKFDTSLMSTASRTLSVADFFLDKQRRHITAALAVVDFKKEALAFLKGYYEIEKADYGIPNFNHRVMSRLVRSTIATARSLKQFSHEP